MSGAWLLPKALPFAETLTTRYAPRVHAILCVGGARAVSACAGGTDDPATHGVCVVPAWPSRLRCGAGSGCTPVRTHDDAAGRRSRKPTRAAARSMCADDIHQCARIRSGSACAPAGRTQLTLKKWGALAGGVRGGYYARTCRRCLRTHCCVKPLRRTRRRKVAGPMQSMRCCLSRTTACCCRCSTTPPCVCWAR